MFNKYTMAGLVALGLIGVGGCAAPSEEKGALVPLHVAVDSKGMSQSRESLGRARSSDPVTDTWSLQGGVATFGSQTVDLSATGAEVPAGIDISSFTATSFTDVTANVVYTLLNPSNPCDLTTATCIYENGASVFSATATYDVGTTTLTISLQATNSTTVAVTPGTPGSGTININVSNGTGALAVGIAGTSTNDSTADGNGFTQFVFTFTCTGMDSYCTSATLYAAQFAIQDSDGNSIYSDIISNAVNDGATSTSSPVTLTVLAPPNTTLASGNLTLLNSDGSTENTELITFQ